MKKYFCMRLNFSGRSATELDDHCRHFVEKHALTLIKVLSSVLDRHPFSYVDFIEITLQYSSFYSFTKEGHELLFDMLLIRWLNLMKAILQCPEYKVTKSLGGGRFHLIACILEEVTCYDCLYRFP